MKLCVSKILLVVCFCALMIPVTARGPIGDYSFMRIPQSDPKGFDPWGVHDPPVYIKNALKAKDNYKIPPRAKKRTINNLTIKDVMEKIKEITKYMNMYAMKNGFKVDYTFRLN